MAYFFRTLVIYLVLFIAVSFSIHEGFKAYYGIGNKQGGQGETGDGGQPISLLQDFQPSLDTRETETGLLLSGIAAQNRRDWDTAWEIFSQFNTKYANTPDMVLKSMTLALGNGASEDAEKLARDLQTYDASEFPEN